MIKGTGTNHVIVRNASEGRITATYQFCSFDDAMSCYKEAVMMVLKSFWNADEISVRNWSNQLGYDSYKIITTHSPEHEYHIYLFEGESIKPFLKGSTATELDASNLQITGFPTRVDHNPDRIRISDRD